MRFQISRLWWVFAAFFRELAKISLTVCVIFCAASCALWDASGDGSSDGHQNDAGDIITHDVSENDASDADSTPDIIDASDAETPDADTPDTTHDAEPTAPPEIVSFVLTTSGFDAHVSASVNGTDLSDVHIAWDSADSSPIVTDFASIDLTHTYANIPLGDEITVILSATDAAGQTTTESQTLTLSVPTQDLRAAYLFDESDESDENDENASESGLHPDSTGSQANAESTGWGELDQSCIHFSENRHGMTDRAVELNDNFGSAGCGSGSVGYLSIPNFDLPTTFTISMWVLSKQTDGLFLYHSETSRSEINWLRFYVGNDPLGQGGDEGKVAFGMEGINGILAQSDVSQPQEWTHYAMWAATTTDPANTAIRLYRNGEILIDASGSAIGGKSVDTNRRWFIGNNKHDTNSDWFLKGKVDDLRFYGRALTEGEIKALAAE